MRRPTAGARPRSPLPLALLHHTASSLHHPRAEVVRRCTDEHGNWIEDMVQDFDDTQDSDDEMEESAKAFYEMLESSKRLLHEHTETFYTCEEGYEEEATKVIGTKCKHILQNLHHKAQPQVVRDYYATCGIKKEKLSCREKFLKKEQYM
ncbi:hypothetical protein ZWY2020_006099 [Hordeum vulgare]|nr:hypothetical protein ZWY2020_006099 [Hordeum vulgare]